MVKEQRNCWKLLILISVDRHLSLGGARYFITFIDDYSRKVFVYFLSSKTGILEIFSTFKTLVYNQTGCAIEELQTRSSKIMEGKNGKTIKILRADNGTDYVNRDFKNYLKRCGIRFQTTCPHTHTTTEWSVV